MSHIWNKNSVCMKVTCVDDKKFILNVVFILFEMIQKAFIPLALLNITYLVFGNMSSFVKKTLQNLQSR